MSSHVASYLSRPLEIADAKGCFVFDAKGKKYLDFVAGWCVGNVGWKNPEVVAAMRKAAEKMTYVAPLYHTKAWEEFAALLVAHAPGKRLKRAFRCTSGSEAVEFAIKTARAATGKPVIVSVDGVYHGHTYGAASVGDACGKSMAPCASGFMKIPMPHALHGVSAQDAIDAFKKILDEHEVAAFLSEPVWTNAGSIIPPAEFYPEIQRLCRERGVLFIMDEVATGFGRCGTLFASELWNLEPDIMCLGKGMTGGYSTMGATLVSEKVFRAGWRLPSYSTFGWNPFDLAAARATVDIILRDRLWENSRAVGAYLLEQLQPIAKHPAVSEVRGVGLTIGIEIGKRKALKNLNFVRAQIPQLRCMNKGLLVETAENSIFIVPPLTLTKTQAKQGSEILRSVFAR